MPDTVDQEAHGGGVAPGARAFQDSRVAGLLAGAVCWYPHRIQRHHSSQRHRPAPLARIFTLLATCLAFGPLAGCGGSTEASEEGTGAETTGGEATVDPGAETEGGTLAETLELPTTTLIPVPSSGVPRHQLSAPLQDIWVAWRRLRPWWPRVHGRPLHGGHQRLGGPGVRGVSHGALGRRVLRWPEAGLLASGSAASTAVARALVGYTYEEFVIAFRGAPVPDDVAADRAAADLHRRADLGERARWRAGAAAAFGACAPRSRRSGRTAPWVEWAQYCPCTAPPRSTGLPPRR
ncbi:MAG: hypothetical protein IPH72_31375 [Sandaracinaceae bacterium]|nr:hypothetical protein [Sandaracinaceae bacterium]